MFVGCSACGVGRVVMISFIIVIGFPPIFFIGGFGVAEELRSDSEGQAVPDHGGDEEVGFCAAKSGGTRVVADGEGFEDAGCVESLDEEEGKCGGVVEADWAVLGFGVFRVWMEGFLTSRYCPRWEFKHSL